VPKKRQFRVAEAAPTYGAELRVSATEFKTRCLELIEQIRKTNQRVVITRHGKSVAVLLPHHEVQPRLLGYMQGSVLEMEDIVSPTGESWEANAED
jgi:prevent-host-death family protein